MAARTAYAQNAAPKGTGPAGCNARAVVDRLVGGSLLAAGVGSGSTRAQALEQPLEGGGDGLGLIGV